MYCRYVCVCTMGYLNTYVGQSFIVLVACYDDTADGL